MRRPRSRRQSRAPRTYKTVRRRQAQGTSYPRCRSASARRRSKERKCPQPSNPSWRSRRPGLSHCRRHRPRRRHPRGSLEPCSRRPRGPWTQTSSTGTSLVARSAPWSLSNRVREELSTASYSARRCRVNRHFVAHPEGGSRGCAHSIRGEQDEQAADRRFRCSMSQRPPRPFPRRPPASANGWAGHRSGGGPPTRTARRTVPPCARVPGAGRAC